MDFLGDLTEFNLTITFMDKKTMTWSLYEAPSVKTLDIMSEGVLCSSYKWTEGGAGTYSGDEILDNGSY